MGFPPDLVARLQGAADDADVTLEVVDSLWALTAPRLASVDVVVAGPDVKRPLGVVHRLHRRDGSLSLVVVDHPDRLPETRRSVEVTTGLPRDLRIYDARDVAEKPEQVVRDLTEESRLKRLRDGLRRGRRRLEGRVGHYEE